MLAVPSGSIVADNDYSLPAYAAAAARSSSSKQAAAAAVVVQIAAKIGQRAILLQPASNAKPRSPRRTVTQMSRSTSSSLLLQQLQVLPLSIGVLFYNGFCLGVTVNEGCTHAARCCPHAHRQAVADEVERENGGEENEVQARLF